MRILIPVDGSADSKAAVKFVASRTTLIGTRPTVELLNVQHPIAASAVHALGREQTTAYQSSQADKVLAPARAALARAGVDARERGVVGSPAVEVARLAAEAGFDLVVMGSHGHTGLRRLLFGSVTAAVLASTRAAVWVILDRVAPKKDSLKVLVAVDGTDAANAAADYVAAHRALFGEQPQVTLIHVLPDLLHGFKPEQAQAMREAAFEFAFAPVRQRLAGAGMEAREVRMMGHFPGDAIADWAASKKFDVVVMGTHNDAAAAPSMPGSVGARVAARCTRPLLLVPAR